MTVDFPLVKVTENRVYFDGFIIKKVSANDLAMYVIIGDRKGKASEVTFNYKKSEIIRRSNS